MSTTLTASPRSVPSSSFAPGRVWLGAAAGALLAAVANLAIYLLAGALGVEANIVQPGAVEASAIPAAMFFVMTLVPGGLIGGGLFALAARLRDDPRRIWMGLSIAVLVLMAAGPFLQTGSIAAGVMMNITHVVAAGAVVWGATRFGRA